VYALYRGDELYYVGLASDLRSRLAQHLRDTHADGWDRFSLYLTVDDGHMRELEALVMRIARPPGNKQRGRFARSTDLQGTLLRRVRDSQQADLGEWFGAQVKRPKRARPTPSSCPSRPPPLAPFADRVSELRAIYKHRTIKARVRSDGSILLGSEVHRAPSGAAQAVVRRTCSGWRFWKWKRPDGKWVALDELRRER